MITTQINNKRKNHERIWEQCRKGNNCKVFVVNLLVVTGLKRWQRNTHVLNEQSLFDACGGMGRRGMYCGGIIRF